MHHRRWIFVGLFLCCASAWASTPASGPTAAATATAAAPAGAGGGGTSAVIANYSTPKDTLRTFYRASNARDYATLRQSIEIPAAQQGDIAAFLDLMEATGKMQVAASAKFSAAADKTFKAPTADTLAAQIASVDIAIEDVKGEHATVNIAADASKEIAASSVKLVKVGGDWKIEGASFFKLDSEPADKTAQRVALAQGLTAIARDVTKKIAANGYLAAADAYTEYWDRAKTISGSKP